MSRNAVAQINRSSWPKDDEIRWVQWRIWEREAIEAGRTPDWNKRGECDEREYMAWILHVRDDRSFAEIGEQHFRDQRPSPDDDDPNNPDRLKRRAQLAYQRVEREFGRGPNRRNQTPLGFAIHAFGVVLPDY